jgi:hypothetical protein
MYIYNNLKDYYFRPIGDFLLILVAITIVCLATATTALAMPPDCSEGETDPLKACEVKLNNAQFDLLDELTLLVDEMENMQGLDTASIAIVNRQTRESSGLKEHIAKMKRSQERAEDTISESINEDFDEMVGQGGKQKGQQCSWKEADDVQQNPDNYVPTGMIVPDIGNSNLGNGDCDKFQAEDETSNKPITVNERSQPNICARICEDKDVPGQQGVKKKDKMKRRYVDRKSEGIEATKSARDAIYNARQEMMSMNIMADNFGARYAIANTFPECERSPEVPHIATWGTKVVLVPVLVGTKILTRVLEGVKDSADAGAQQDVAGFNASVASLPGIIAYQISQGAVDVIEGLIAAADLTNEGFEIFSADATHTCVTKIREEVDGINTTVDGLKITVDGLVTSAGGVDTALEDLQKQVLDNRKFILDVREILLTPYGRRSTVELEPTE